MSLRRARTQRLTQIAIVQQEAFFFKGELRENLTLGGPIDDSTLRTILEQVHFHSRPGYDAVWKIQNQRITKKRAISFEAALRHYADTLILDKPDGIPALQHLLAPFRTLVTRNEILQSATDSIPV